MYAEWSFAEMKCRLLLRRQRLYSLAILATARAEQYEIFLLAGQSNMDGRGAVKDLTDDLAQYAKAEPQRPDPLLGWRAPPHAYR